MKVAYLGRGIGLASVVLLVALVGSARAKDEWFVLGEKTIKCHGSKHGDQGRRGEDGKEDIKKTKIIGRGR